VINSVLEKGHSNFDGDGSFCKMDVSGQVQTEFQYADFGDTRLTDRLVQIGDELGSSPAESIRSPARTRRPQRLHTDFATMRV